MTNPYDKNLTAQWLKKYAYGVRSARHIDNIVPFLQFAKARSKESKKRYFRAIMSELKAEGIAGALSSIGCFHLRFDSRSDVQAAIDSEKETESRALAVLEGSRKRRLEYEQRLLEVTQGQGILF